MRATIFLIIVASLKVSAGTYAQTVTYSGKNVPLKEAFAAIKKQTGFVLLYKGNILKDTRPVTVAARNQLLETFLKEILKDQPLDYTIQNQTIFIFQKKTVVPPVVTTPPDQQPPAEEPAKEVTGTITNTNGLPLSGASIKIRGTSTGTASDAGGKFSILVTPKQVLVITYIGYQDKIIKVGNETSLNIQLLVKETALNEVVINKGYYSTTQRMNTGSVSRVTSEDIGQEPILNVLQVLQGRVTGLQITQSTGLPGSNYNVQVRGQNSLRIYGPDAGNFPLYVVDGVPYITSALNSAPGPYPASNNAYLPPGMGLSPLNSINPADIESIEVLKDADATSIYGSRGANGVILITTKKGKAGKMTIDGKVYTGIQKVPRKIDLLNTQQYLAMRHEALKNSGATPLASDYDINGAWDTTRYTDWQKVLIGGTAHITDANLALSGGTANMQYRFGGGYHRETTVFPGDYADQRASAQFSLNASSPNQRFKTSVIINYSFEKNNMIFSDLTATALSLPPDAPALYDSTGGLNWQKNTFISAPNVNPLQRTQRPYQNHTNNLIGNVVFSYDFGAGFVLKTNFGYTTTAMKELTKRYATYFPPSQQATFPPQSNFGNGNSNTWIVEPQLSWHRQMGKGNLNILVGSTFQRQESDQTLINASGFLSQALMDDIQAATQSTINSSYNGFTYKYNAGFGRISYEWDRKYLLNITARRDGSSRFGPNRQFANFASAGLGWIFSEEAFVQKALPFLSFGKLRGSYGSTGNDHIPNYGFLNTYSVTSNYVGNPGLIPYQLYNPDFGWEVNKKLEGALELGFLKDRLMLTASYYHNRSSNQLVGYVLPPTTGFTSIQANLPAVVQNTGVEIELHSTNINTKAFTWKTSFTLTIPRNKLVSYPNLANSSYAYTYEVGKPLNISKVYHYTGLDSATGLYMIQDVNKDGFFGYQDQHSAFQGQYFYGGLQNSMRYKGFQLDILFQFVKQNGPRLVENSNPGAACNQPVSVLGRWQQPGDNKSVQAFGNSYDALVGYFYYTGSDASIVDASFIRLKNLSLTYQLPQSWMKKAKIQSTSIFLQGQNLLTFTGYKGLDPETQAQSMPPLRTITAGLQFIL